MFIATGAVIVLVAVLFGLAYPKTFYGPGYSRSGFQQIRPGMSAQEVRRLVGEPLFASEIYKLEVNWLYSLDVKGGILDCGHRSCWVILSNNVVVTVGDRWLVHWGR